MRRQNDSRRKTSQFSSPKHRNPTSVSSQVQDLDLQVTQDSDRALVTWKELDSLQDILSRQIFHPQVTPTVPPTPFFFCVCETLRSNKETPIQRDLLQRLTFQKFHLHFGVVVFLFNKFSQFFFPAVLEGNLFTSY